MVGGGLSADEEALSDFRVGEPEAHEVKNLLLSLREDADVLGSRPARFPERAEQRRGLVCIGRRTKLLEDGQGGARLGCGKIGLTFRDRSREFETNAGRFEG